MAATRQGAKQLEITADQRFLLGTPPSFDLALGFDRIGDSREFLLIDKLTGRRRAV